SDIERTLLRITTIRAFNVTIGTMAERRKKADRERKAMQRSLKRLAKPETITHRKPWLAQGISRTTWYRHCKAQNMKARETKCVCSKEKNIAADRNCLTLSGLSS